MEQKSIAPQRLYTAGDDRNVGRHTLVLAGGTVAKGDIVMPDSTTAVASNSISVTKAAANNGKVVNSPLFVAAHPGTAGGSLRVAEWWVLSGQNTSGAAVDDPVYLSDTAGGWSLSPGTSKRRIGTVLVVHASAGVVLLAPNNVLQTVVDSISNTAVSTAITGTTEVATNFDRTQTIKANRLRPGSRVRVRACGIHTATTGAETHTMALKFGSVTVASKAAIDPANNDIFYFDFDIVIRTIGAGGTLAATGVMGFGASGTMNPTAVLKGSTAIDTTADIVVAVNITRQAAATDADSAQLEILAVEILD